MKELHTDGRTDVGQSLILEWPRLKIVYKQEAEAICQSAGAELPEIRK